MLLAPELTRDALFEAMRAHRGYGTRDRNLEIDFTVDGAVMGADASRRHVCSHGERREPQRRRRRAGRPKRGRHLAGARVDGGEVIGSYQPDEGNTATWSTTVQGACTYIYLRVSTAEEYEFAGPTAWTAPVWMTP